jgi:mono/diheme cytochrome c family protein
LISKAQRGRFGAGALLAAGMLGTGGCASLQPAAPAVTPAMSAAAAGASMATLEAGRRTFVTGCTACHSADPVTKYSPAEWREIVADMSPRTKLNAAQESALLAYILAARESVVGAPSR